MSFEISILAKLLNIIAEMQMASEIILRWKKLKMRLINGQPKGEVFNSLTTPITASSSISKMGSIRMTWRKVMKTTSRISPFLAKSDSLIHLKSVKSMT